MTDPYMSDSKNGVSIGFLSALVLIFITLKLIGKITWSWWWVFAPWWIPAALVLFVLLVAILISMSID